MVTSVNKDVWNTGAAIQIENIEDNTVKDFLNDFDSNNDGTINLSELKDLVYIHKIWKNVAKVGICVIMVLLASIFALTILANELSKDSKITDDALVVSGTNHMVQTATAFTHEIPIELLSLVDQEHLELVKTLQFGGVLEKPNGEEIAGTQLTFHIDTIIKSSETSVILYAGENKIEIDTGVIEITLANNQGTISKVCGQCSMFQLVTEQHDYRESLVQRAKELGFEGASETNRRQLYSWPWCYSYFPYAYGYGYGYPYYG